MSTRAENLAGGLVGTYDDSTHERFGTFHPVVFYDDFIGADLVIPAVASEESGVRWSKKIVGAAPPTVAKIADASCGALTAALTATSEKQDAELYMSDQRNFDLSLGLIFEARVKVSVLPTGNGSIFWGVCGDWADGPDAITHSAWFATRTADAGLIKAEVDDAATDQTETTGVTVTNTQFKIYRIDFNDLTNIKFFIDGVQVATTTKVYAATGANAILQPFLGCYKVSGTGLGSLTVDYVRLLSKRS